MKLYLVVVDVADEGEYGTDMQLAGVFVNRMVADGLLKSLESKDYRSVGIIEVDEGREYPLLSNNAWTCKTKAEFKRYNEIYFNEVIHLGRYFE